ncbi:MAG: carbonic anhydrase [Acidimicrobiales bacterium]
MAERRWDSLLAAHRSAAATLALDPAMAGTLAHTLPRHAPKAAILSCSDARVPPSVVFDQPAGELFVVRIAGNTATPAALASLDYAVAELDVKLIVVMGHTGCGAVAAAAGGVCGGHLKPIVAPICRIVRAHPGVDPDRIAELNVSNTMDELRQHDGPVGQLIAANTVDLQGAVHDLRSGQLIPFDKSMPQVSAVLQNQQPVATSNGDTKMEI